MLFDEIDVHRAFGEDEFFPAFQPIVELRTGQLVGFEALARWRHGKLGAILPGEFIPFVEKSGLIDRLTQVILEKAFASRALVDSALTLSVNISPQQLVGFKMPERVATAAERGRFALDRLTIEITESALVDDLARAKAVADELKSLNCRLALDDFGTGYSSLRHLHALPFDQLKVDRSFTTSMIQKRESRKIVASVVGLGQSLGLSTAAEGIETQEQADMLFRMGCDLGQGWLFGKPITAEELPALIAADKWPLAVTAPNPLDESSHTSMDALPSQRLAQLQAIYDGVPVGLCFLDRNLRYLSLNKRIARMNGVPAAAHLGRTVAEVIPDLYPRLERCIRRALNGKPTTGVEVRVPAARHGEKDQTLLISYQPVCDEAKEVLGVSMAIMDITEHRGIERALRESEDHYRSMVKLSPHIPWVLNIKGEITEPSPGWEALTGQTAEESVGTGWLKAIHPDDYGAAMETLQISIRTGQPIDTECRVRRSDGEWVWIRSRGSPRFGPTGRIVCFYGLVEEVHAQRQNTEELLAIKAKSRAALEAVPVGIIIADALDGAISMVNPAAKDILGDAVFPGQKLAEYGGWGLTHADGRVLEADEYPLARAILRGEAADVLQLLLQRSDGSQLNLSLSGKPIHSEEGQLIGGVMMIRTLDDAG